MDNIKLNFINGSNDQNNSTVVIFQKNVAADIDESAVAWRVVKNCAVGFHHSFSFPLDIEISALDSWGNEIVKPIAAVCGSLYHVHTGCSENSLSLLESGSSDKKVQLLNNLKQGSIDARIYRDERLLAVKCGVLPEQKAVFEFKPSIWIGVVPHIEEGQIMNSAITSGINTEISLLGIKSADIVMTGGGPGPESTPYKFTLENVEYA